MGNIYLLCDPSTDLYKIGMTRGEIDKRIKELQTGNSCEIHLVASHETSIPSYIESALHNHFSHKNELNEWFSLSTEDIASFKDICEHYEEIADCLQENPFFKYKKK